MFFRLFCLTFCLFFSLGVRAESALVLGYLDQTQHEVWQDNLVGFGVRSQLVQALYEKTSYQLIDEKIGAEGSTAHIMKVEDSEHNSWMLTKSRITSGELSSAAVKNGVDTIFWVEVTGFGKPSRGFSIGAYYSRQVKTIVKVRVCRYTTASGRITCGDGEGSSKRRANAFLYQIRDDRNAPGLFQKSSVGKTSNQAVINALDNLLAGK